MGNCPVCESGSNGAVILGSMMSGRVSVRCRDCGLDREIEVPDSFEMVDEGEEYYE
jgi:transcription elongation factor Elf1